jgi:hypothetical protein
MTRKQLSVVIAMGAISLLSALGRQRLEHVSRSR